MASVKVLKRQLFDYNDEEYFIPLVPSFEILGVYDSTMSNIEIITHCLQSGSLKCHQWLHNQILSYLLYTYSAHDDVGDGRSNTFGNIKAVSSFNMKHDFIIDFFSILEKIKSEFGANISIQLFNKCVLENNNEISLPKKQIRRVKKVLQGPTCPTDLYYLSFISTFLEVEEYKYNSL